ncbi:MAG: amidohydrolase [Syntrophales bacterium]
MRPPADLVIRGGTVYTADPSSPVAEALAVKGERIAYVGGRDGVADWIGPQTEVIDGRGRLVIPGFRDSHIHPIHGSLLWIECVLAGEDTVAGCLAKIASHAADSARAVIRGNGWRQGLFTPQGPHRTLLDAICPDRPVYLTALDGHSAWVNSSALRLAGLGRGTPDPLGGKIERDPQTGEPTGTLREWPAMNLVADRLPPPDRGDLLGAMEVFMEMAARDGIVAVQEAAAGERELEVYRELDRKGSLTMEIGASLLCEPNAGPEQVDRLIALRESYGSALVRPFAAKIFLDGVLESHTAYLSAPYEDQPDHRGALVWPEENFRAVVSALDRQGFDLHVHAVGDTAIATALDAFAAVGRLSGVAGRRHQVAHLDLLTSADMDRLRELAVIANMQPVWFYEDESFREVILPAIGPERAATLYRLRTLLSRGVQTCLSSDWPYSGGLSTFNPLEAIQVGLTRKSLAGGEEAPFLPKERVGLESLIDGFTIASAFAGRREADTGSLTPGRYADIAVLEQDLFAIPAAEISRTKVLLTLFRGRAVYRDI